jgi:hypothetical protein
MIRIWPNYRPLQSHFKYFILARFTPLRFAKPPRNYRYRESVTENRSKKVGVICILYAFSVLYTEKTLVYKHRYSGRSILTNSSYFFLPDDYGNIVNKSGSSKLKSFYIGQ